MRAWGGVSVRPIYGEWRECRLPEVDVVDDYEEVVWLLVLALEAQVGVHAVDVEALRFSIVSDNLQEFK